MINARVWMIEIGIENAIVTAAAAATAARRVISE
jgi:hypothetical protein